MLIQLETSPVLPKRHVSAVSAVLITDIVYLDVLQNEITVKAGTEIIVDLDTGIGLVEGRHMNISRNEYLIFS